MRLTDVHELVISDPASFATSVSGLSGTLVRLCEFSIGSGS